MEKILVVALCRKALILCKMRHFDKAYQVLLEAEQISKSDVREHLYLDTYSIEDRILYESAFERRFTGEDLVSPYSDRDMIFKLLAISKRRKLFLVIKKPDGQIVYETGLDRLEKNCPGILPIIQEIVGQDLWRSAINDKERFSLSFSFESIYDQLNRRGVL